MKPNIGNPEFLQFGDRVRTPNGDIGIILTIRRSFKSKRNKTSNIKLLIEKEGKIKDPMLRALYVHLGETAGIETHDQYQLVFIEKCPIEELLIHPREEIRKAAKALHKARMRYEALELHKNKLSKGKKS